MKKGFVFFVIFVFVLTLSFSQTDGKWTVSNAATWIEAVNGIRGGNNNEYTITIIGNVSVPASNESTFGTSTNITVNIEGSGTLSMSNNGTLLSISNGQTVIVKDLILRGRDANSSSVVFIGEKGVFHMEGNASVTGNSTNTSGGGVYNNRGEFIMRGSSSISNNTVSSSRPCNGGGVYNIGTFVMQENASVTGNTNRTASSGGSINFEGAYGGGVCNGGTFTLQDNASISSNTAINCPGGGIYNSGTFNMQGGTISGNNRRGVYSSGTFIMQGGTISSNIFSDDAWADAYAIGGGVFISGGTFTMQDGVITGNTANAISAGHYTYDGAPSAFSGGGGVYLAWGTFTMQGGTIMENTANASNPDGDSSSYGGGVYVGTNNGWGQSFIMEGGVISNNTSSSSGNRSFAFGGGVYVAPGAGGTFTMQGNASISDNKTNGDGGGVYVGGTRNEKRPFIMKDQASVSDNTASGSGGGVYVASATSGDAWTRSSPGIFIMQDDASVYGNTATYNGGGVFNGGTFTKTGGIIYGDDGDTNYQNTVISRLGFAIYDTNSGGWRNATAGSNVNSNSYGFLLNDGDVVILPSGFEGTWKRSNFNNILTITQNTIKASSSNNLWVLQSISSNSYTFKRSDAANTFTLTIRVAGDLIISGDSGSGENNWNGTWKRQRQ